jgi:multisubunit Na+/H+ antiporter MnhE subunit
MLRKPLHIAPFWIVEFAVLFGLYLLFASSLDAMELYVGLAIAALAGSGMELARAQKLVKFRPRPIWLAYVLSLPWYTLSGAWEIFLVLAKHALRMDHPRSLHRAVRFDAGASDAASAARRALATTYTTVPPNFIVLDILRDRRLMLYHQISPSGVPKITEELGAKP